MIFRLDDGQIEVVDDHVAKILRQTLPKTSPLIGRYTVRPLLDAGARRDVLSSSLVAQSSKPVF